MTSIPAAPAATGGSCDITPRTVPGLSSAFTLHPGARAGGRKGGRSERALTARATREARRLARAATGDPDAYVLMLNGASLRHRPEWHVHVFVVRSRWERAWLHLLLAARSAWRAVEASRP